VVINGVLQAKLIQPGRRLNVRVEPSEPADTKKYQKEENDMKRGGKKKGNRGGRRG
jgi:hypothetical protein